MEPEERPPKNHSVQFALTVLACSFFLAVYVLLMRAIISVSHPTTDASLERRDEAYAAVHIGVLGIATVSGFILGKWFNGLGLAYALLFFLIVAISMLALLLGTYELACHGHNDLIRHWQCGPS